MQIFFRTQQAIAGQHSFNPFYHAVGDHPMPHLKHLLAIRTEKQFIDDLQFFLKNFTLVTLKELIDARKNGTPLPKNFCFISVDDGLRETHDIMAPILEKMGCPATFFICSDFVDNKVLGWKQKISLLVEHLQTHNGAELATAASILQSKGLEADTNNVVPLIKGIKYSQKAIVDDIAAAIDLSFADFSESYQPFMTSDQISSLLAKGFSIGSHSIDHPLYKDLDETECLEQSNRSMDWLQDRFGISDRTFAYPFHSGGLSRSHILRQLDEGRFELLFGTAGGKADVDDRIIQRNMIEDPQRRTAQKIVTAHLRRSLLRRITGRNHMRRAD